MVNKKLVLILLLVSNATQAMEQEIEEINEEHQLTYADIANAREDFRAFIARNKIETTTFPWGTKIILSLLHFVGIAEHIDFKTAEKTLEKNKNFYAIENHEKQQQAIDKLGTIDDLAVINVFYDWWKKHKPINILSSEHAKFMHTSLCTYLKIPNNTPLQEAKKKFGALTLSQEQQFKLTTIRFFEAFIIEKEREYFKRKRNNGIV